MKTPLVVSLLLSPLLCAYEMHEWGTFTTVSGSDGKLLSGLHVEEEHLPPFVHSHVGMAPSDEAFRSVGLIPPQYNAGAILQSSDQIAVNIERDYSVIPLFSKGLPSQNLHNVTVKMETPVIYFYGDDTEQVNVKVGFNGGTISQWYPKRKSGDTPNKISIEHLKASGRHAHLLDGEKTAVDFLKPIDFSKPYSGSIEWDVEILPKKEADIAFTFKPFENYTWIYPRVTDANMLKVGDEYEDYLFYRGIGNFELPATFSVDENENLTISNNSKQAIPFALAFENIAGKYRYKVLSEIPGHDSAAISENDWISPENQQVEIYQAMRAGLVAQGLTEDEANGMVRTWWKSYFYKPGLRVFWVVPNYELEKVLPLTLSPEPEKSVRVMVGRADIMRPSFEQKLITQVGTRAFDSVENDRFYLPYKQRLEQLITTPVFTKLTTRELNMLKLPITAFKGETKETATAIFYDKSRIQFSQYGSNPTTLPLSGSWNVIDNSSLRIGEHTFVLDKETGILTATLPEGAEWERYEIQLKRYLN